MALKSNINLAADNASTNSSRKGPETGVVTEKPLSKVDEAYVKLEEKIVTMDLPPGVLLSENELATQLGLGRTPVREALQRLARQHLVEIMPRRGIRVSEIDVREQLRLIEVRKVLEQLQANLAAKRASEAQRARFFEIADEMESAAEHNDYLSFVRLDSEYNTLMSSACDNMFAGDMLNQLHGLSRRFWHRHYQQSDDLPEAARLHAQVARAIARGNELFAEGAAMEHMNYIYSFTKATLDL